MMCVDDAFKDSINELLYGTPKFPLTSSTLEKTVCKIHDLEYISKHWQMTQMAEEPNDKNIVYESLKENRAKLIFILRDWVEIACRQFYIEGLDVDTTLREYIRPLKQYDEYQGPKLLVKYDLVTSIHCL